MATGAILLAGLTGTHPAAAAEYAGLDAEFGPAPLSGGRYELVVDQQDRTVVLGKGRLQRFGADGTPDAAFGDVPVGVAHTQSTLQILDDGTISVLLRQDSSTTIERFDDDGDPLASFGLDGILDLPTTTSAHEVEQIGDGSLFVERPASSTSVAVARYDATGQVDPSYGTAGTAQVPCCDSGPLPLSVTGLVVDADGLDLLVARGQGVSQGGTVIRLDEGGDLVGSVDLPSANERPSHLVARPDGSLLVVGQDTLLPTASSGVVRRIAPDRTVDAGFGDDGAVRFTPSGWSDPIQQPGRVVLVLGSLDSTLLALDAHGIDASFGTDGRVSMSAPSSIYANPYWDRSIRTVGLDGGRILTVATSSWNSINQLEPPQRTIITERTPDGAVTGTYQSGERWLGDIAPRHDGSASVVFSMATGPYLPTPNVAYLARWVPTDPAALMGPVRDLGAEVDGTAATVTWTPPTATPGLRVTGYEGRVVEPDTGPVLTTWSGSQVTRTVTGLAPGRVYRVEVRPVGPAGAGPLGPTPLIVIPHFASVAAFADRLARDFVQPPPTPSDVTLLTAVLSDGSVDLPGLVLAAGRGTVWKQRLDPVVRLYSASFGRPPDRSGLTYWMGRRAAGVSLARISASFAASSEFTRTYGRLSNRSFVALVYRNVLGREADPGGLGYWTARLDRRATSRGHLMASFSESTEHVRRREPLVRSVGLTWGMVHRVPTAPELQRWTGVPSSFDERSIAGELLASEEYLARLG
jgi:hypothetical protein